jgi:hypothetical protein
MRRSTDLDFTEFVIVASARLFRTAYAVLVFDCDFDAQVCEPIGRIDDSTQDPLFLDGAGL